MIRSMPPASAHLALMPVPDLERGGEDGAPRSIQLARKLEHILSAAITLEEVQRPGGAGRPAPPGVRERSSAASPAPLFHSSLWGEPGFCGPAVNSCMS